MSLTRYERTIGPAPVKLGPGRAAALAYIADELRDNPPASFATLVWMRRGAELSRSVAPNLEYGVEGQITPGQENAFVLRNSVNGQGDFAIPNDPSQDVVDKATGQRMGTLRAVTDLGRWIVEVATYSLARSA